ncbi:PaaI family thioesterase [Natronocalculus amylovorans]|uniref:PaaI family thioesterase n=1 Tax=Natronocalculus amylovorans TaxID=2917812 RepID=A0AAE3FXU4_9EURY|nr:PaaI family thioesterase [Natronocalculus amylovorans]MCL9816875.1 PaaI family thioesterase [Natronocalculus amylovorans]NUE01316.1 PaaI family thioesterase [Halorubraceae archaeon YAN]
MTDAETETEAEFDPDLTALLRQSIEKEHGYLSWLGTTVEEVEKGRLVLSIPFDEKLTNTTTPPTVHGGVAATLIDTAGGVALRTMFDEPTRGGVATVNLNVNYLRRADGDLRAIANVVRAGESIGVSEMRVESPTPDGGTKTVVTGQGSYRLFRE